MNDDKYHAIFIYSSVFISHSHLRSIYSFSVKIRKNLNVRITKKTDYRLVFFSKQNQ